MEKNNWSSIKKKLNQATQEGIDLLKEGGVHITPFLHKINLQLSRLERQLKKNDHHHESLTAMGAKKHLKQTMKRKHVAQHLS
ncbi:MAG: hypothetical protein ACD_73C00624G0001 [uncultured bacterium]|nr:MAG: hypothetical protein ACD_73C00624G0001 [uncultured bacterium]